MQPQHHGPLCVVAFQDPMFQENTYLVWHRDHHQAVIIDPGFSPATENALAASVQRNHTVQLEAIWLTHCHADHIAGIHAVRQHTPDLAIYAPYAEAHFLTDPAANLSAGYGIPLTLPEPDVVVRPGDGLSLATVEWETLDVAGHSPGGLAFYCPAAGLAFVGDALFRAGIGRTDFPGSSLDQLLSNISHQLLTLPEETIIYPGHGPATTVARERDDNPFLQRGAFE
jgi:hydroxyacylglutathione hydrolase